MAPSSELIDGLRTPYVGPTRVTDEQGVAEKLSVYKKRGHWQLSRFRIIDVPVCNDIVADIAERISFTEHGRLVAESSEFHFTLSRAHKAQFFPPRNTQKKRDILSEKR